MADLSSSTRAARPRARGGIRSRLLLLALIPALPLAAVIAVLMVEMRGEIERRSTITLTTAVGLARHDFQETVRSAKELLSALASNEAIFGGTVTLCGDTLAGIRQRQPVYAHAHFADLAGDIVCSGSDETKGVALDGRGEFRRAIETTEAHAGEIAAIRPDGTAVLPIATAVRDDAGRPIGVVHIGIGLAGFLHRLAATHEMHGAVLVFWGEGGRIHAHDPAGGVEIGARWNEDALVAALRASGDRPGIVETRGADGVARLFALLPVRTGAEDFWLAVGLSTDSLFGHLDRLVGYAAAGIAAILALAMFGSWLLGENAIRQPIVRLVGFTTRVRDGDLGVRVSGTHGPGEIGDLADAFDAMAAALNDRERRHHAAETALEQARAGLEEKVADRTARLAAATLAAEARARMLEAQREEMRQLSEMSDVLQSCQTVDEARGALARACAGLFGSRSGGIYLFRESGNLLELKAEWGDGGTRADAFAPDGCWAIRLGRTYVWTAATSTPRCDHAGGTDDPYCCVPMTAQGRPLGLLHATLEDAALDDGPDADADAVVRIGESVGERAALALANIRLRQALRDLSIRDPLTGLFNRRYMEETLERELAATVRTGRPLSVLMLDVDHFKRFNDTHGHEAGDAALRTLGNVLARCFRATDVTCRFGGEEFVVLLPDTSLEAARAKAEALCAAVRATPVALPGGGGETISVSVGVATCPQTTAEPERLLEQADAALYAAKHAGRDRVATAPAA